jgi:hypothetical protein
MHVTVLRTEIWQSDNCFENFWLSNFYEIKYVETLKKYVSEFVILLQLTQRL